jgi:AbrB family looped-hinge helix DNA binding protein
MTKVINITGRGTVTLPKELRRRAGIKTGGQLVAQATDEGILLRAKFSHPVEIYGEKRLAEFKQNNETALAGFRFKK